MKLILPNAVSLKISDALVVAKQQEIGGLLVGEHIEGDTFRIVDASIQTNNGTRTHFERDPAFHTSFLKDFFRKTGDNYTRFNYLGEWHSHPSFAAVPSSDDMATMDAIVRDPQVGVNFAVLLIVRATGRNKLSLSATAFSRSLSPTRVDVEMSVGPRPLPDNSNLWQSVGRLLKRWLF